MGLAVGVLAVVVVVAVVMVVVVPGLLFSLIRRTRSQDEEAQQCFPQ